ncbi:MAG: NUDIX hydrolase [Anaeroplasmataceae bacterium]
MRLLGENDYKDYDESWEYIKRNSARMIIIKDNKIYLSHRRFNDTYKLPGGGVDKGEEIKTAAIRETLEEVGVIVDPNSIEEYGYYIDKWKSVHKNDNNKIWLNKSYYFTANPIKITSINPTESEIKENVESVLVDIDIAIKANELFIKNEGENLKDRFLIRELEIFKIIKQELIK